jgi:dethiobiotin synthetase
VVVELAGGLFTPLAPSLSNADVALALRADRVLLVTLDRLGVLHEVAATARAAEALGLSLDGIVVVAPPGEHSDASTGTNAAELRVVTTVPVVATIPRESIAATSARPELTALLRRFL